MKIQNKLLLLAIASVVSTSITPSYHNNFQPQSNNDLSRGTDAPQTFFDYGRTATRAAADTGTAVEAEPAIQLHEAAAMHQRLSKKQAILSANITTAKEAEATSRKDGSTGKLVSAHAKVRTSLEAKNKHVDSYLESLESKARQLSKKIERMEKQLKSDMESIAKARDKRDEVTASETISSKRLLGTTTDSKPPKNSRPGNVMNPKMMQESKESRYKIGGNPSTWAPVITYNPSTGYTYIQTYDKDGILGSKKVYKTPSSK
ncbi:MAG: hypothetical protein NTZ68_03660 [Candidatus Dependentiae bacterium]|nr:hypothetical protein [Candidatus Dependentiae bacterium]